MKKYRNYTIASLFSFIMGFSLMYGSISIITNPPQAAIAYNKKPDFLSQNNQITTNLENLKEQNEILEKKIENSYENKIINQDNKNTLTPESPQNNSQKEEFDLVEKNLDYVKNNINEKEILIDLEKMKLLAYEKGNLVHDINIVSKGRPNSYFETPVGEYKIGIKNIKHFSSIGKVYLPYSVQFFGNFFIHGIPEHPNGKKVNSEYSGGCIRLNDQDAKTIYYFADQNTKIKILDYPKTNEIIKTKKSPSSNAIAYAIMDIKTGKIIAEQNSNKVLPIASITKLMTAIISLETINQEHFLTLTLDSYNEYGDSGKLIPLAKYKIKDLLYPMLLTSSNDAAKALANHYGYDSFINMMNKKAEALTLKDTYFKDSSGLSPENVSSAYDLSKLIAHIYSHKNYILSILKEKSKSTNSHIWENNIQFKNMPEYMGGKSGYTPEANRTYAGVFKIQLSSGEIRPFAIVVLGSSDRVNDVNKLIEFIKHGVIVE